MKKLLLLVFCLLVFASPSLLGQYLTNKLWSSSTTSNYIRTNLDYRLATNNAAITGAAPVSLLFSGATTNVYVIVPGGTNFVTNIWSFTNGLLLSITNVP